MKKNILSILISAIGLLSLANAQTSIPSKNNLRPPATPLITIDPHTSAWSFTDKLYEGAVKHWTGKEFPLVGAIKVDGTVYRFMGTEDIDLAPIAKTSEQGDWTGTYSTSKPAKEWVNLKFNDSAWRRGKGAFGTPENEVTAKTHWGTKEIWVRRVVTLTEDMKGKNVFLEYSHDDDAIISINGIEVVNTGDRCSKNKMLALPQNVVNSLVKGDNIIAAYCHNRAGNALLDFGLLVEKEHVKYLEKTAIQKSLDVQATQTHYLFACGAVDLKLTFTAPLFMDDLALMARPVNYISYEVVARDQKAHDVAIYFEASPKWALDKPLQESVAEGFEDNGLVVLKTGTRTQEMLSKAGDDLRIDWGYFYMTAEKDNTSYNIGDNKTLRSNFVGNVAGNTTKSNTAYDHLALTRNLGKITKGAGKIMLGYDDIYSIQYFGTNLRPYWNADNNQTILSQLHKANNEYAALMKRCSLFDKELIATATKAGGKQYAELCALAYRQSIAAHKLVKAPNGDLLFLSKENFSNGSIGTVDITYPSSPMYLYYNPELAKGMMNPIFYYSESNKWVKPFPAHDVGTYPLANGQTYGGDMPVEEAGNMLITTAAVAKMEGNADYAAKHWKVLTIWTDYLVEHGLDPENQLCTDDFAGHFAHNTNLSIKAIMAIASYGQLAETLGKKDIAAKYTAKAREMATEWTKMAADGNHYRLTFDKADTWSQKYNLVWDKLLETNIFPKEVATKEIAYYLTKQNKYGLPLDNRRTYTKTDWIMWTATLAPDKATFEKFISPIHLYMNETTDRVPMSDWVYTDKPQMSGFQARSVVGGYYIKMLESKIMKAKK